MPKTSEDSALTEAAYYIIITSTTLIWFWDHAKK